MDSSMGRSSPALALALGEDPGLQALVPEEQEQVEDGDARPSFSSSSRFSTKKILSLTSLLLWTSILQKSIIISLPDEHKYISHKNRIDQLPTQFNNRSLF